MTERKLTRAQSEALGKVCATNGGGVRISCKVVDGIVVPVSGPMRALYFRGLIQGKSGSCETVVHTREGLLLWRETHNFQREPGTSLTSAR